MSRHVPATFLRHRRHRPPRRGWLPDSPGVDGSLWVAHGGQISVYDWSLAHAGTLRTHLDDITSAASARRSRRLARTPPRASISTTSPAGGTSDLSTGPIPPISASTRLASSPWATPRTQSLRPSSPALGELRPGDGQVDPEDRVGDRPPPGNLGQVVGAGEADVLARERPPLRLRRTLGGVWVLGLRPPVRPADRGDNLGDERTRFGDLFAYVDADPDESRMFKLCSKSGDVGVADLRNLGEVPWVYLEEDNPILKNPGGSGSSLLIHCYKGQVFVGRDGNLEVWSRVKEEEGRASVRENSYKRNFVDKEEIASRGIIRKMEGGGERLFVSREEVEGIEVWESSDLSNAISVS